jgi:hypothetical protein
MWSLLEADEAMRIGVPIVRLNPEIPLCFSSVGVTIVCMSWGIDFD